MRFDINVLDFLLQKVRFFHDLLFSSAALEAFATQIPSTT
jgi:hypothetical protein